MHFTGTIWRPPYEAGSLLLEATAGCTHHKCKFCTLYEELPFKFRMSPLEDVESDLKEAQAKKPEAARVFLTGANPFVLTFDKLIAISELIRKYFPDNETIGCFARITDIALKTDDELLKLRKAGYDGLTIGIETADDEALQFMKKGYAAIDILEQCKRLDGAGISYSFFYLVGISGAGRGREGARATARVINELNPKIVGANMLTIYKSSMLYAEIESGAWQPEGELEKYEELIELVENLKTHTVFAALGASNAIQLVGELPRDREMLLKMLRKIVRSFSEQKLAEYRKNLRHL